MQNLSTTKRAFSADFIKAIAIFGVVVIHSTVEPYSLIPFNDTIAWITVDMYSSLARFAVPLFVMVSGVLLLDPSKAEEPVWAFFKKRFWRIIPAFVFWTTVYFIWRFYVNKEMLTGQNIIQDIFTGPYYHFWFIYMLVGIYLFTPVLRVFIKYAKRSTVYYFALVAVITSAIIPLLKLCTNVDLNWALFLPTGWLGYYLLGYLLKDFRPKMFLPILGFIIGTVTTAVGTYVVTANSGGQLNEFFHDNLGFSIALSSISVFLVLNRISVRSIQIKGLVKAVAVNSLSIYLMHLLVLETIERGHLGFKFSSTFVNPAIEIPIISIATFIVTSILVLSVNKLIELVKISLKHNKIKREPQIH